MNSILKIFVHNWLAILYFNFKVLPIRQAVKLPFDFYYKVRFENIKGKIKIDSPGIHRAMIKIGGRGSEMFSREQTIIDIKGNVLFKGITEIGAGCLLRVEEDGNLFFGNKVRIGAKSKIFCENNIVFGDEIDFSWECQIFDTNFHFMKDISSGRLIQKTGTIEIGSYNWFGNRVNVMKGTKTPENMIVASNSLCNKDYTDLADYSLLAGSPAKCVKTGIKRMFEGVDL
ncbi:MAG: hypothetical protein Q8909_07435 [Bacteroidota bacterium]|nr:hypothetical protein [Bacteroidota bacterium]